MRYFNLLSNSTKNHLFSNLGQLGTKIVKRLKNDEVNKHIPVLDIAKNKSPLISGIAKDLTLKKVQCDLSFIRNNVM